MNFALGVRDFDPAQHRPHPPGYPAYIALGKAATAATAALWPDGRADRVEARALAAVSLLGAVLLLWWTPRALSALALDGGDRQGRPPLSRRALLATLLAATTPLTWYMTVAPDERRARPGGRDGRAGLSESGLVAATAGARRRPAARAGGHGRVGPRDRSGRAAGRLLRGLPVADAVDHGAAAAAGARPTASAAASPGRCSVRRWRLPPVRWPGACRCWWPAAASRRISPRSAARPARTSPASRCCISTPAPRLAAFTLLRTFVWPWDSVPLASVVLVLAATGGGGPAWSRAPHAGGGHRHRRAVPGVPPRVPGHDLRALRPARGVARRLPRGRARSTPPDAPRRWPASRPSPPGA